MIILLLFILPLSYTHETPEHLKPPTPYQPHMVVLSGPPDDIAVEEGRRVRINCSFSGWPSVAVEWKGLGQKVVSGDLNEPIATIEDARDGVIVVNTTLTIDCISSVADIFTCWASNGVSLASAMTFVIPSKSKEKALCEPYVVRPKSMSFTSMVTKERDGETVVSCEDSKKAPVLLTVNQETQSITDKGFKTSETVKQTESKKRNSFECVPINIIMDKNVKYSINSDPFSTHTETATKAV